MENLPELAMAGDGDHVKEINITDDNVIVQDNSYAKKEAKEKQLRQKISMYLESKNNVANAETKKGEEIPRNNLPKKPCNHFNDFGTCKYETGHFSNSGDICLIHVCRYCHDSSGKKELHPATLCVQLKTKGVLQNLGVPLKVADLNKDIVEKGNEKELGEEIAANLYEPKIDMIVGVVNVIGRDAAAENFKKTQKLEFAGGMMVFSGTRRRTAGGTFLQLLRENTNIDQEKIAIFLDTFNGVQTAKMKRKEEMYSLQGRSFHLNKSSSVKSFLSKSDALNDRLYLMRNSRNPGDASPEKLTGMKEPNVMVIPPINDRMNEINSKNVFIPKQRAGPVVSKPGDLTSKSTPRSSLVQSEQGNYGMSTPKSRLSESMENYMVSAGSRRDAVRKNETYSCVGRTQRTVESRTRFHGSQADNAIWKDARQDSRKASIEHIIGCLNEQRTDPIKNIEEMKAHMSTKFRNEPWPASYHVAKQKAVHNLESGNLQSVSGVSGYCGQVTNVSHVASSNSQIGKLMSKMKMEGRKETANSYGGGVNRQGSIESMCELTKTPLNPKAVPFNPSMGLFNPATPPPVVNVPYGFLHLSQGPEVLKKERKCHESEGSKVLNDKSQTKKGNFAFDRTKNFAKEAKLCSSLEEAKKIPDISSNKLKSAVAGMNKERKKNHCPCPPYCPSCLEKIKAQV